MPLTTLFQELSTVDPKICHLSGDFWKLDSTPINTSYVGGSGTWAAEQYFRREIVARNWRLFLTMDDFGVTSAIRDRPNGNLLAKHQHQSLLFSMGEAYLAALKQLSRISNQLSETVQTGSTPDS